MARITVSTITSTILILLINMATAQSPQTVTNPGFNFSYIGCYRELENSRALAGDSLLGPAGSNPEMTVEICAQFCSGYTFMGVEYSSECYCSNTLANGSSAVSTEYGLSCTNPAYACAGNSSEFCGGYKAYNLYAQPGAAVSAAANTTGYVYVSDSFIIDTAIGPSGNYTYIGCYDEPGVDARALNGASTPYGAQNVEACANFCAGYTYFGLENGGECYCGNTIDNGASPVTCQNECYTCCASALSERCGGFFRLSMYELAGPAFVDPSPDAVCTYNGPAMAIPTVVDGVETSVSYYGPITTGSMETGVVVTDAGGATTSFVSTEFFCVGGVCNENPHT